MEAGAGASHAFPSFAATVGGTASSTARLAGRVLAAERRRNAAAGLPFDVIRVRSWPVRALGLVLPGRG